MVPCDTPPEYVRLPTTPVLNKIYPAACIVVLLIGGCQKQTAPEVPAPLRSLVYEQARLYPDMQLQDWYKLFHQAAMGNRHLGVEDSVIYNYMLEELSGLAPAENEVLVEYITPDSSIVRLNLRPYKALAGAPAQLFAAMQGTWEQVVPKPALLESWGASLALLAASDTATFPFTAEMVHAFFSEQQAAGFPAMHHSQIYSDAYAPAYRVLQREFVADVVPVP